MDFVSKDGFGPGTRARTFVLRSRRATRDHGRNSRVAKARATRSGDITISDRLARSPQSDRRHRRCRIRFSDHQLRSAQTVRRGKRGGTVPDGNEPATGSLTTSALVPLGEKLVPFRRYSFPIGRPGFGNFESAPVDRASVFRHSASALRHLPISIRSTFHLSPAAARRNFCARTHGPAHARQSLSCGPISAAIAVELNEYAADFDCESRRRRRNRRSSSGRNSGYLSRRVESGDSSRVGKRSRGAALGSPWLDSAGCSCSRQRAVDPRLVRAGLRLTWRSGPGPAQHPRSGRSAGGHPASWRNRHDRRKIGTHPDHRSQNRKGASRADAVYWKRRSPTAALIRAGSGSPSRKDSGPIAIVLLY